MRKDVQVAFETALSVPSEAIPKGPKYQNMEHYYFCVKNRNFSLGYMLHIWILGRLG